MGFYDNRDNNDLLSGDHYNSQARSVKSVHQSEDVAPNENRDQEKKHQHSSGHFRKKNREENLAHFHDLLFAAEQLQKKLEKGNYPFRFSLYLDENGEIIIEKVKLDEKGSVMGREELEITHEEFRKWITDFYNGEGLLFDFTG